MKNLKFFMAIAVVSFSLFSCSSNDDNTSSDTACEVATSAAIDAAQAYASATPENFVARCNAYRAALENQIEACGDSSGAIQDMIDSLGDCSVETNNGVITVNVGSSARTFENVTVTSAGANYHVLAVDAGTDYSIEFDVAQGATGADIISNFEINLVSPNFTPLADNDGGNWTSNITTNNSSSLNGTFSGIVVNPDNAAIELTAGVIDLDL